MSIKKSISNQNSNVPKRKYKYRDNKHINLNKIKVVLQVVLFFTSWMFSVNVANEDRYAKLTALTATLSTTLEIFLKTKLLKDSRDVRVVVKKVVLSLNCATITFLNVYLFNEHDASRELINILLLIPSIFVYLVVWRINYQVLVEVFFPCTCLAIMYNCYLTSNVFGAVAALLSSWAYYTKKNFKIGNEVLDHNDVYNLLMCFFFWFCQEAIKFERLIKDMQF